MVNAAVCKTAIRGFDPRPDLKDFTWYVQAGNPRFYTFYTTSRPGDGTGIRSRLKIGGRKACGFDSHPGHQ